MDTVLSTVVAVHLARWRGVFTWVTVPATSVSMEGTHPYLLLAPLHAERTPQSLRRHHSKMCPPSLLWLTRNNFRTIHQEDGNCKSTFQTRQLLKKKKKKDSRILPLLSTFHRHTLFMYELCLSSFRRGKCWQTITCRQTVQNPGCLFLLKQRHIYFPMRCLPDRCKDVGKPVIRINRAIVLALHILICMTLIFSHAQKGNKWKILF